MYSNLFSFSLTHSKKIYINGNSNTKSLGSLDYPYNNLENAFEKELFNLSVNSDIQFYFLESFNYDLQSTFLIFNNVSLK